MVDLRGKDILDGAQFTREELDHVMAVADDLRRRLEDKPGLDWMKGYVLATLFFEPSTRTRLSFEAAMHRLGGSVIGFSSAESSSTAKGESLADTIRTVDQYADIIAMRHPQIGSAKEAAAVANAPIFNGGDGAGQHPTQALLDLYTIYRERPLDGLSVAFIGELDKGRTARSLAYLLAKFERVKIFFVSPPELQMKPDILQYLDQHGVRYELESDIDRVVGEVDVIYQTRILPERIANVATLRHYAINSAVLQRMRPNALILHPLPRTVELDKTVDDDPRALYFRQATNGLYVRMALLTMLLDRD